jgi:2-polyprenyl-3-methyl-5-hydroxy-6-metoxy-1,4-benzoquinol methylase
MKVNPSLSDLSTKPAQYFNWPRSEMLTFVPSSAKRILDVGCGEGTFARNMKERRNAEVWGAELVPAIAQVASTQLDKVLCGDIMQQLRDLPDAYFDCITFNDVIEHLADPYTMLAAMKRKLSPEGVIVCSIPNVRSFRNLFELVIRGEWQYAEAGILDKTHLRFFTRKSIAEMFTSLGYEILRLEGINPTRSLRVTLFNIATLGFFNDTRYLQFACVAKPIHYS